MADILTLILDKNNTLTNEEMDTTNLKCFYKSKQRFCSKEYNLVRQRGFFNAFYKETKAYKCEAICAEADK